VSQVPFFRELDSALSVADLVFDNWNTIKDLYERYRKKGLVGVVDSRAARETLASLQTRAVWEVVRRVIPKQFHDSSYNILSKVVDKITDEEIRYVRDWLQKSE
jgi:G3E family GTPase